MTAPPRVVSALVTTLLWSYQCFLRSADSSSYMTFVTLASIYFYIFLWQSSFDFKTATFVNSLFIFVISLIACSVKMLWRRKYPLSVVIITIFVIIQQDKIRAPWSIIIQPVIRSQRVRTVRHHQPLISRQCKTWCHRSLYMKLPTIDAQFCCADSELSDPEMDFKGIHI